MTRWRGSTCLVLLWALAALVAACGSSRGGEESGAGGGGGGTPSTSPGSPDTSFNGTGFVTRLGTAGGLYDDGFAVAVDSQDRIVVTGRSGDVSGNSHLAIWRYTSAGILDTAFNGTGFVTRLGTAGGDSDVGKDLKVDSADRIVVTGNSEDAGNRTSLAIWRYLPDGTPDSAFNGTGFVTRQGTAGGAFDYGEGIAIDGQGRIVVTGYSLDSSDQANLAIWRYLPDGTPDTAFNGTGFVTRTGTVAGNEDLGVAVALDSQHRIVVAGVSADAETVSNHLAIWRYLPDGTPDTAFNGTGFVTRQGTAGGTYDLGTALAVDSQDRIVVTGYSYDAGPNPYLAIWRYLPDGTPDTAFNGTGFVTKLGTAGGAADTGSAVAVDGQGRIVVAGQSQSAVAVNQRYLAIWRYTSAGILDTAFNGTGFVTKLGTAGGTYDIGFGMTLDRQGRILVAGESDDGLEQFLRNLAVWRYHP